MSGNGQYFFLFSLFPLMFYPFSSYFLPFCIRFASWGRGQICSLLNTPLVRMTTISIENIKISIGIIVYICLYSIYSISLYLRGSGLFFLLEDDISPKSLLDTENKIFCILNILYTKQHNFRITLKILKLKLCNLYNFFVILILKLIEK